MIESHSIERDVALGEQSTVELRAILIDMEGAIVESEEMHRRAFNAAFREFGMPWHWDYAIYRELLSIAGGLERLKHYITRTAPDILKRPDGFSFLSSMHKAKNIAYDQLVEREGVSPRPGVQRLLAQAYEDGIKMAVVTSATLGTVQTVIRKALGDDARQWFEVIADGGKVPEKKPAPDIYIWAMEEMGVSASGCLSFEDTPRGVKGSRAVGLPSVATVSSYTRDEDFDGALAVISDLGEPDRPFQLLAGSAFGHKCVTVELLRKWHRSAKPLVVAGRRSNP